MTKPLQVELEDAIQLDVFTNPANRHLPPQSCAEQFYDTHPDLIDKLKRPWMVQRITNLIKNRMQRGWPEIGESTQIALPGFEDLPRRIFLKDGGRKLLDKATIGDIRQHLQMLRKRFREHPKIKQMQAILELMEKYAKSNQRVTWKQVKQKEFQLGE